MFTLSSLKKLDQRALRTIGTDGPFGRLNSLMGAASCAHIAPKSKAPVDIHLSFTLPTRLREDPGKGVIERDFHVGCCAEAEGNGDTISKLSYSVLIGEEASPSKKVARKFHFDYEPLLLRNPSEVKPTFHLQMCGELSPHHISNGYCNSDIEHLLPSWSQPRIPAQPMSLALIIDWLLIEFGKETSVQNARISPAWRSVVREAEREILTPYYKSCYEFLTSSASSEESFLTSQLYEVAS